MDLNKLEKSKQLTYRLASGHQTQTDALMDKLMDFQERHKGMNVNTLDFLGMLWMGVQTDRPIRRPKTRAERMYMVRVADALNTNFNTLKYYNPDDPLNDVHIEMIERCKLLLMTLHFGCINPEIMATINKDIELATGVPRPTERSVDAKLREENAKSRRDAEDWERERAESEEHNNKLMRDMGIEGY